MTWSDFKDKCKQHSNKIASALAGGAVMLSGTVTALAAEGDSEGVQAAKTLLSEATKELNITNAVAIIAAGIGAVLALVVAWWGARKLFNMLMKAFKKGKASL